VRQKEVPVRVLVAEDEPVMADTIAEGLRRRAMAVDVCYDGVGRERGSIHERGPGGGDGAAQEAGRPAGDRDRAGRGLPARLLNPLRPSLRRRMTVALVAVLIPGYYITMGTWNTIHNLYDSFRAGSYSCTSGQVPFLPNDTLGNNPTCAPDYHGTTRVWILLLLAAVLVLAVWILWIIAGWTLQPLSATVAAVRQFGPQNLGLRIRVTGAADPLKELADALDDALDRLAAGYESQRRFAANASHELRTPLAVQRLLTEVAMEDPDAGQDLRRLGTQLLRTNERNEKLIEGLLVLAESDRGLPGKVPVRLDDLVATVLDGHLGMAGERGVTLRRKLDESLVSGDPVLLERLIANLVSNAITYNEPGGWVEVAVAAEPALTVRNTGQNVPAEAVPALFEPFRRLGADRVRGRGGVGLGLAIVRSIVTAHQGTIDARPRPAGGLIVEIRLPARPYRPA
jgi:signal transduction histidine kinase